MSIRRRQTANRAVMDSIVASCTAEEDESNQGTGYSGDKTLESLMVV